MYTAFLRIALEIALYVDIWRHAHWSVALAITLVGVHAEAQITYAQATRNHARMAQREAEKLAKSL